jgi:hypothetical protein
MALELKTKHVELFTKQKEPPPFNEDSLAISKN